MNKKAYLAGGCFWGLEELFRKQPGVVDTEVGYSGGTETRPTWMRHKGHAETIEVTYNPEETTFANLLEYFFRVHDPTTKNRQGNDIGSGYRSAIFYQDEQELETAERVIQMVNESGKWRDPVVTTLEPFSEFYTGEGFHQDYLQHNPGGYTCHFERFDSFEN